MEYPKEIQKMIAEEAKRKAVFRKKLLKALLFFVAGIACTLASGLLSSVKSLALLARILEGGMYIFPIIAVCTFAGALHDPLTPEEAKELAEKEKIEKGSGE